MSIDHISSLKALHLYGMAAAWTELQAEKPRQTHRPETWMERLITAEQTDRQLKSLRYQLKSARFPHSSRSARYRLDGNAPIANRC